MRRRILQALAVACMAVMATGCSWFTKTVYSSILVGDTCAMTLDSSGTVHVVYTINTTVESGDTMSGVFHARGTPGGTWTQEEIYDGGGTVLYADAIGVGADGTLHAFYRVGRNACHASSSGSGSWSSETFYAEESGPVGGVAFDANGGMHVVHSVYITDTLGADNLRPYYSYRAAGGTAFTATEIGHPSGWTDVNYGKMSSLAVGADGRAYLMFGREMNALLLVPEKLYFSTVGPAGGTVNASTEVDVNVAGTVDNSVCVASDGTLHAACLGYASAVKLKHLVSSDGGVTWAESVVDDTEYSGYMPSLKLDAAGGMHAGYLVEPSGATDHVVKYAYLSDAAATWTLAEVATNAHGDVDLCLDASGSPLIVYPADTGTDAMFLELRIAWKDAGAWTSQVVKDATVPE